MQSPPCLPASPFHAASFQAEAFGFPPPGLSQQIEGMDRIDFHQMQLLREADSWLAHCRVVDQEQQALGQRVSKLERSRGQISKDLGDMVKEVEEWSRYHMEARLAAQELPRTRAASSTSVEEPCKAPLSSECRTASEHRANTELSKPVSRQEYPLGLDGPKEVEVEGNSLHRVTWRFERTKFKDIRGPMVSSNFSIKDKEFKLMVQLDDPGKDPREKGKAFMQGCKIGLSVRLKAIGQDSLCVNCFLFVGRMRQEHPCHNFGKHIQCESQFDDSWMQECENETQTYVVGCDIGRMEDAAF